jgi:hypothetical protein
MKRLILILLAATIAVPVIVNAQQVRLPGPAGTPGVTGAAGASALGGAQTPSLNQTDLSGSLTASPALTINPTPRAVQIAPRASSGPPPYRVEAVHPAHPHSDDCDPNHRPDLDRDGIPDPCPPR